jgi:membrane-associated protein
MSVFLTTVLTFFQSYGYPALWVSIFIAAVGAPLPVALVLLASGAFAALGDFNVFILALVSISASVAGDNIGYLVGRKWGSRALDWLGRSRFGKRLFSPRSIERSRAYFNRRGGWAVFLTRFLIAALGGITNLIAGSELFPYRTFLACDIGGEVIGAVLPLSLGFVFGTSWEDVGDILSQFSLLFLALLVAIILFLRLLRYARNLKRLEASNDTEELAAAKLTPRISPSHASHASHAPHASISPMIDPPTPSSGPLPGQ